MAIRDQPQILDYITVKAEVATLEKARADWQRKLELAGMEAHRTGTLTKRLNHTGRTATKP